MLARVGGAVALAKGMATGDEGDRLGVVHRHPAERLPGVARRGERVGLAVGPLGVDVVQAHLDRAEGLVELAVAPVGGGGGRR